MPERAFTESQVRPAEAALEIAFAAAYPRYRALLARLDGFAQNWSFTGTAKTKIKGGAGGWLLKVQDRRKALLYVVPCRGAFVIRLTVREGERQALLQEARLAALHPHLAAAPRVGEGYLLQFDVAGPGDHESLEPFLDALVALRR